MANTVPRKIFPKKLKPGDEVRVIAPSKSIRIISKEVRNIANRRFKKLGLKLSFGKHVEESDRFGSSSIKSRIEDFHKAFADKNVKAILTVIGGFNSNQLLRYLDWDLIKRNPKIFCGYSDIAALNNAILAKTGLVSYSGPHYSTFGQKLYFDYTLSYFKKCLFNQKPFQIKPSKLWSDDLWYIDQGNRELIPNKGTLTINEGKAEGIILGSNLCTFNLLQGTEYMPDLSNSILFLEEDEESKLYHFDRNLQSLLHLPNFPKVKGLLIGRFQKSSKVTNNTLIEIIKTKKELDKIPVVANVDFGHTDPKITFPIGGTAKLIAKKDSCGIWITKH